MKLPFRVREKKFPVCARYRCRHKSATDRKGRRAKRGLCHKCYQEAWRANNPLMSYYRHTKDNASKRKLKFELTFKEFKALLPENWRELTIDRINPNLGYVKDNIQFLTLSENTIKGNKERHYPDYINRRHVDEPF